MSPDEAAVAEFLAAKGLIVNLFSKEELQSSKTPDFRVYIGENFAFYCEVKSIRAGKTDGLKSDPIFNRLTNDIHLAAKQFHSVNPSNEVPNVLAFVNHDNLCGFLDLIAVYTGNHIAENGAASPIYRQFSEGRIKNEKSTAHLVIWLDDFKPYRLLFTNTNVAFHDDLCDYIGINSVDIKIVDA